MPIINSGSTFLDEYRRLTSRAEEPIAPAAPDETKRLITELIQRRRMPLTDVLKSSSLGVIELGKTVEKLQKLGAIELRGNGTDEELVVTDKANDLLELFSSQ